MPFQGAQKVNGEPQKRACELIPEVVASLQLSALRKDFNASFIEVHDVLVCRGQYPGKKLGGRKAERGRDREKRGGVGVCV